MDNIEDMYEKWEEMVRIHSDMPKKMVRASFDFVLSSSCGQNVYFYDSTSDQKQYLNLWYLNIAKSRIGRKTTCFKILKDFLNQLDIPCLPYDVTTASLIKSFANLSKEVNPVNIPQELIGTEVCFLQDECSRFFEGLKRSKYSDGIDKVLSSLYDGETYTKFLATNSESLTIKKPYLTMFFASTTSLFKSLEEYSLEQGFMNRWLPVICNEYDPKPKKYGRSTFDVSDRLLVLKNELLAFFEKINESDLECLILPVTQTDYDVFEAEVNKKLQSSDEETDSFYSYLPDQAMKIACLRALSDNNFADSEVIVTPTHFAAAKDYLLNEVYPDFILLHEKMTDIVENKKRGSIKATKNFILNLIRKFGDADGMITHSKLMDYSNMSTDDFKDIIEFLLITRKISRSADRSIKYKIIAETVE